MLTSVLVKLTGSSVEIISAPTFKDQNTRGTFALESKRCCESGSSLVTPWSAVNIAETGESLTLTLTQRTVKHLHQLQSTLRKAKKPGGPGCTGPELLTRTLKNLKKKLKETC